MGGAAQATAVGTLTRIAAIGVVAVAAAVTAVLLLGRAVPLHGVQPVRPLTVNVSFDPPAVQFGSRVVAQVVVLADRDAVDTSQLRVTEDVAPLTPLGKTRVTRTNRGRLAVITYAIPAVCMSEGCLAKTGSKELRLPPARVAAPRRSGGNLHAADAWPLLSIGSRVDAADLKASRPQFRGDTSIPAVTYRIAPGSLSLLLDIVAAVLAAAAVGFAVWQAVVIRKARRPDTRTALERALALVREAETRMPEDRRRAVGLLARVLGRQDDALARTAGDLAWSEPAPGPDDLAVLADRVGQEVGDT
jgi:hypothetical protein